MRTIAVIGAGYWGKNLIRTFQGIKTAHLKYIVDSDETSLKKMSNSNALMVNDYQTVLTDDGVDAVVIASPAVTHYEIARASLLAGKHVFVEKPMTLESRHSQELVVLADRNKVKLMVGHLLLYHPCINAVKESIDKGEIGEVYYLYCQRLNLGKVRSDENALLSFAPHDISIALYLIGGKPDSISAYGQSYLQEGIEDVVFVNLHFPDNKIAHIHVSWLDPHKVRRTTVVGSEKMIVFDDMEPREKIRIYDKGVEWSGVYGSYGEFLSLRDGNIFIPVITMVEPLKIECEHFLDCIENNRNPRSDGRNGLIVTQILENAQMSLQRGGIPIRFE